MTKERRAYVEMMMEIASDFSDGAFWAFMDEKGIALEEVLEMSGGDPWEGEDDDLELD